MLYPGFVGGAYLSQSRVVAGEESINLYPSPVKPEGATPRSQTGWFLQSAPGKKLVLTLDDAPGRGLFAGDNRLFAAAGASLYEVFPNNNPASANELGDIAIDGNPVQFFQNGLQAFVVSARQGYLHNGVALLGPVVPAQMGAFIDGYFLAQQPDSNIVQFSAINDGTQWPALQTFVKSGAADRLKAIACDREVVWLLGQFTTDLFQNTGDLNNPFQRIAGAVLPIGIAAPWSLARIPDGMAPPGGFVFLAGFEHGTGVIVRAIGQSFQRVSNHAIETAIQNKNDYPTLTDAVGMIHEEGGHVLYSIRFPSAYNGQGITWVLDLTTGYWHRRAFWSTMRASYGSDKAGFHAYTLERHYVLHPRNGNVYEQSPLYYDDDGDPLRRLRSAPHLVDEKDWITVDGFELDMQTGFNPNGIVSPQVMFQYSRDGGQTWGNELLMSVGNIGQYKHRLKRFRLGQARDWAFRTICSDAIPVYWTDAYLDVRKGL